MLLVSLPVVQAWHMKAGTPLLLLLRMAVGPAPRQVTQQQQTRVLAQMQMLTMQGRAQQLRRRLGAAAALSRLRG
jgi:hypothetical protein